MPILNEEIREIAGTKTRFLRGGSSGETVLFLHGGIPGQTPYCSFADIWSPCLPLFAKQRQVVALDLPGAGGTTGTGDWLSITAFGQHVRKAIEFLKLGRCHVVGHDQGGLVALWLALESPELLRSISIIASPSAAPTGDSIANLTLAYPPQPLWSRESQEWAYGRLSYAHHHVDAVLLDRCGAAAAREAHRRAIDAVAGGAVLKHYGPSVAALKSRFYDVCRDAGLTVPVQIVWGTHDPLTTVEHGMMLTRVIAAKQTATHFHLINRAGAFPFREEPETFHEIVAAFHDGMTD